jgi:hypothetical protein
MLRALRTLTGLSLAALTAFACSTSEDTDAQEAFDTADPRAEDLRILPGTYSSKLVDNILPEDANVAEGFGLPDERVPYPDTYWPFNAGEYGVDGTDFRWQGNDIPSPTEKFAAVVYKGDAAKIAKAKKWEHDHHGPGLGVRDHREVSDWEGHCPGWTGASMSNAPLVKPVFVKPDARNTFASCTEAEAATGAGGCTRFDIGDINALMAEVYVDGKQPLIGAGCFTSEPSVDEFDRIKRNPDRVRGENGVGCRGLNPGALLMVLGNHMKKAKQPFAINAQQQGITDQIWNQPVYRYTVNSYEEIDQARAIELVAANSQGTASPNRYIWNAQAKGFVVVDISLHWVREMGPNREYVSGRQSTMKHRVKAVIELDKAIVGNARARASAKIIGGEYLTDDAAAASNGPDTVGPHRLSVPSFVWISVDAGPEDLTEEEADNRSFQHHNPFIKPSLVKKLIALGQR